MQEEADKVLNGNAKLEEQLKEKRELKLKTIDSKAEEKMTVMLVEQSDRSVKFGVVGVGQCGSKLAEEFYNRGYSTIVINTAMQDLTLINIPESKKLLLDNAIGGAAKSLENGKAAAEEYAEAITEMMNENFEDSSMILLIFSGGGGTGSGAGETMVRLASATGKPVMVLYVLPLASDDAIAKSNAVQTLAQLAQLAKDDVISSLMVVDNAKIELMFAGLSMAEFWKVANSAIVEPLHLFNKLSSMPSEYTSLDSMDFIKVLTSGDCSLYGMIEVENYQEETAVAEAMVNSIKSGLLSDNFDLTQTRAAGVIITGSPEVLKNIPATNIEYGFAVLNKVCSDGVMVFRGVYAVPSNDDVLRIYTIFAGLGLPEARIEELRLESEKHMELLKTKENSRASSMNMNINKTNVTNKVDALHKKIVSKNSAMGKMMGNARKVIDKRRK